MMVFSMHTFMDDQKVKKRNVSIYMCKSALEVEKVISKELSKRNRIIPDSRDARILLKPNLNSNMNALTGNTTDLRIIAAVIRFLKARGYRNIIIGEGTSSGFYRNKINVFSRLKIDKLAEKYNVEIVDLNYAESFEIKFEEGSAHLAKICKDADLFINLPKLKMHFETMMSVCLKNLIGCLVGLENKQRVHYNLYKNIIHINKAIRPHIHIVDGLISMEGTGPSKGTPIKTSLILIGEDPFIIDLLCARIAGVDYKEIPVLRIARELGIISKKDIDYVAQISLPLKYHFKRPSPTLIARFINNQRWQKYFIKIRLLPIINKLFDLGIVGKLLNYTGLRQDVFIMENDMIRNIQVNEKCDNCGICEKYCPALLSLPEEIGKSDKGCISCLYCYFICPKKAVSIDGELGFLEEQVRQYGHIIRSLEV